MMNVIQNTYKSDFTEVVNNQLPYVHPKYFYEPEYESETEEEEEEDYYPSYPVPIKYSLIKEHAPYWVTVDKTGCYPTPEPVRKLTEKTWDVIEESTEEETEEEIEELEFIRSMAPSPVSIISEPEIKPVVLALAPEEGWETVPKKQKKVQPRKPLKTRMCKFGDRCFRFKKGECTFAHSYEELAKCHFGAKCYNKKCTFRH